MHHTIFKYLFQKSKQNKKGNIFHWYVCKRFYQDDNACCAVMCYECHDSWELSGIRKQDEPTEEEKNAMDEGGGGDAVMQTAAAKKNSRKAKKPFPKPVPKSFRTSPKHARCKSSRTQKQVMSNKKDIEHVCDENGCQHEDIKSWERQRGKYYMCPKVRARRAGNGLKNMNMFCCDCKKPLES